MRRLKKGFVAVGMLLALGGFCRPILAQDNPSPDAEIKKLQRMHGSTEQKLEVTQLRFNVIREAAYALGVQSGVCWQQKLRLRSLENISPTLDHVFNFSPLLLEGDVLPPVIIEAGPGLRIEKASTATSIIKHYKIIADAKFVSTPPNWRFYLMQSFEKAENVNAAVLPKNSEEQNLWNEYVEKGFHDGIKQADLLFETQLNTLIRDYRGIVRFHLLAKQGIAAMPRISRGEYGITVNGKELKIGERVFRVSGTQFQKADAWKVR